MFLIEKKLITVWKSSSVIKIKFYKKTQTSFYKIMLYSLFIFYDIILSLYLNIL